MSSDIYHFREGGSPLLISMPHSGTRLPATLYPTLTHRARRLPDTDWYIPRLYAFAENLGASILQAEFSRYVIDLNRPPDDAALYPGQASTALCPTMLFDGSPLYIDGKAPDAQTIAQRRSRYWQPYHDKLSVELRRIRSRFGFALLYDAHSIASRVPRLFNGRLPDLNLGTAHGRSCHSLIERGLAEILEQSGFPYVINGRFVGGYITRHYGDPTGAVHAVQMEIAQCAYLDEVETYPYNEPKAQRLQTVLISLVKALQQYRG